MNVRKFIAANARDALRKVKETLGNDAISLSNRGIPGGVEIMPVAARDMAMIVPTQVADTALPIQRAVTRVEQDDDYRVSLNAARAQVTQRPAVPNQNIAVSRQTPQNLPPMRHQGLVNAGIPKTGSLRNFEPNRVQASLPPINTPPPVVQASPTTDHRLPDSSRTR